MRPVTGQSFNVPINDKPSNCACGACHKLQTFTQCCTKSWILTLSGKTVDDWLRSITHQRHSNSIGRRVLQRRLYSHRCTAHRQHKTQHFNPITCNCSNQFGGCATSLVYAYRSNTTHLLLLNLVNLVRVWVKSQKCTYRWVIIS